jgi:MFS family permease
VAPSLLVLAALQTLSRNFAIAAMLSSDTVSVEEVPAGSRAAVQGLGALAYGAGAGMVILLLPLADIGTGGWRLIFGASVLCAPLIALAARDLPESRRFLDQANRSADPDTLETGSTRVRLNRFLLVGALLFLVNFFVAPSSQLQNDYLTTDRGFSGAQISLFIVVTALPAFFGIVLGGRWADNRGRRVVLVVGLSAMAIFGSAIFILSGAGMWASATAYATLSTVAVPALGVLAPELFPTARRGTARGLLAAVATVGSVAGLLIAGVLADSIGYGATFALVALAPAVCVILSFFVPETVGAELEDLNENVPDRASP